MRFPKLSDIASGVAVGAVDLAMHKVDAQQGYKKPFENATDIYRAGLTIGSMLWYGYRGSDLAKTLFDNGLPLLTESAAYAVGQYAKIKIPGAPTADPLNIVAGPSGVQPASPTTAARIVVPSTSGLHYV